MKRYQEKRKLNETAAQNDIPVWPVFEAGDPSIDEVVYRFFDRNGEYKGWCGLDTGHKFLMGKLYYKTKGAYCLKTRRSYDDRSIKKIHIYEKSSTHLAAYAVKRKISAEDLIDNTDRESLCKMTREHIVNSQFTAWNFTNYPNKYKVIPVELNTKFHKDMENFLNDKKQELLNYLDAQIVDVQQSKQINALTSNITGVEVEGLV